MGMQAQWQVLKFGGTSVSSKSNWQNIAKVLQQKQGNNNKLLIVHSALSGVSNQLEVLLEVATRGDSDKFEYGFEQLVKQHQSLIQELGLSEKLLQDSYQSLKKIFDGIILLGEVSDRMKASVMAQGELWATKIGHAYLNILFAGKVYWLDAREHLTSHSDDDYLAVTCDYQPDATLQAAVKTSELVITQGFIASNENGETVLTGRGGSDTSAAYFSAKLLAQRLEIWTDVEGIFTANPNQIQNARLLNQLHYNEAQEMASAGAKVLHPSAIRPVRDSQIPTFIRPTLHPEIEGTKIHNMETNKGIVKAITAKQGVTLISMESQGMWQQAGYLADLFQIFKKHQVSIDLVSTSETNVTVTLDCLTQVISQKRLTKLTTDLTKICRVTVMENCSAVSIVGQNVRAILHKIAPALNIFETYPVYLLSQAASDLNLTFVIDSDYCDKVIASLHELLISNNPNSAILGPTVAELHKKEVATEDKWWQNQQQVIQQILSQQDNAYLYQQQQIEKNIRNIKSVNSVDRVFFAVKANNNQAVLQTVYQQGLGFEAVSIDEIRWLLELLPEMDRQRIFYTPNFASKTEYQDALELGVILSLDSSYPLIEWPSLFAKKRIFLRVDPNIGKGHHENVRTAGATSKFGIPINELEQVKTICERQEIAVTGLHAHAGSGILSPEHWAEHARLLADLAQQFAQVKYLNLGGGFGIKEKDEQQELNLGQVNQALSAVKSEYPSYEFWIEPGRYLIANAGVLVARVTQVKQKQNYYYVGINTGMNSLMRPALYGSYHPIVNFSKLSAEKNKLATIVGPICESTDKLGIEIPFPETQEGDIILIENAGAYGYVMSNQYNMRKPAQEFMI
ncbi:bifunctional aspartate kinase/diaminopimelate decarboxylase [Kangiella sp. TOML190]|uniref:bifunctional aspartate kinase/diaminopimelate decarboxylase n=1 Tax=Kangiella sp. TOML190 TaxID=2931351 RepID=UPI00203DE098|nr:bifunctional aspartate kinase/diaminopimelate decarboxylase [Kangiella sp. TOML190]